MKKGFARNFLLPRKLAVEVTDHNVTLMENKKKKHQKKLEMEKLSAVEQKQKLDGVAITIKKKAGENDVLFGSVTTGEIEKELKAKGISVEKKKIHLDEPIKRLGEFTRQDQALQGRGSGDQDRSSEGWRGTPSLTVPMALELNQALPHDEIAEKALLGAMLLDNRYVNQVFSEISSEDFFRDTPSS